MPGPSRGRAGRPKPTCRPFWTQRGARAPEASRDPRLRGATPRLFRAAWLRAAVDDGKASRRPSSKSRSFVPDRRLHRGHRFARPALQRARTCMEEIDQEAVSLKFHSDDIRSLAGPVVVEDDIIDALASFARKVSNEPILDRGCILCFALRLPREVNAGPIEDVDPLGVERAALERRTEQFRIDEERPVSEVDDGAIVVAEPVFERFPTPADPDLRAGACDRDVVHAVRAKAQLVFRTVALGEDAESKRSVLG